MRGIGLLFLICGMLALCYFMFMVDTTVENEVKEILGQTVGGGRTHNLGLMNERVCGMIGGTALLISGAVMAAIPTAKEIADATAHKS